MGEGSKQVRVDNWGVFFLQRLQTFFNKTDYCDLTLQFEGNVQLKVHRLVINACTEYFHILEETCETVDDVLIMPEDLQADVILPIINFMYTGMLEFHTSIFEKLCKTADLMNITVLTKLLDAQKAHMHPKIINKRNNTSTIQTLNNMSGNKRNIHSNNRKSMDVDLPSPLPGRKLPVWKRRSFPVSSPLTSTQTDSKRTESQFGVDNTPKPTRFEWPEEEISTFNLFDSSFNEISYTSKPLLTQEDEPRPSTSFDRIKELPDTNQKKSSNNYSDINIDMNDMSDYVKEQRIRSSINMDNDDDDEDDDDDDVDNDYCEDSNDGKRKLRLENMSSKRIRLSLHEKENHSKSTKINITPTGKATSDEYHTKLISEVLKKYPNLVKKNKNIRLKILAKGNNSLSHASNESHKPVTIKKESPKSHGKTVRAPFIEEKGEEEGPWKCERCSTAEEPVEFVLYYLYRKHLTDVHNEKIDNRVCKYCGHKSPKYSLLVYHQYTRHCINPHPTYDFPKCDECPYIAPTVTLLLRHKQTHSKGELRCPECFITFTDQHTLTSHVQITGHSGRVGKTNFDCQYCVKKFPSGFNLFAHIRLQHRADARRDGIVSVDEFDEIEQNTAAMEEDEEEDEYIIDNSQEDKKERIKILQDVKLPSMDIQGQANAVSLEQQNVTLEPSSEAEALSNVASGIATSLGLVDVVVLDENNQQYILHTADNQQTIATTESEFILPQLDHSRTFTTSQQTQGVITQSMLHEANIGSTDELVMVLTDHDYNDGNSDLINNENSNIVVLYSHPIDGQENQFITTTQGNLMLTSQTGLIELRNGNTVVTSASPHFISSATENQDSQIESIEMIQREINQHPNDKSNVQLVQEQQSVIEAPSDSAESVTDNTMNISEESSKLSESEETTESTQVLLTGNFKNDLENSNKGAVNNDCEHLKPTTNKVFLLKDIQSQQESSNASAEETHEEDVTENSLPNLKQSETINESSADRISVDKDDVNIDAEMEHSPANNIDNNVEIINSGEDLNMVIREEKPASDNEKEETKNENSVDISDKIHNSEKVPYVISKENINAKKEETGSPLNDPQKVVEDIIEETIEDNLDETVEDNSEEAVEINSEEAVENNSEDVENNSEEVIEDNSEETVESTLIQNSIEECDTSLPEETLKSKTNLLDQERENEEQHKEDVSSEKEESENSQSSITPSETTEDIKKQFDKVTNNSGQSAKIILDDWEDTDSQQSDSKVGTNVNKLIDDWDDEEDDNK